MNVLVTGAAGFLGSHITERLLRDGHEVVGLDSFDDFYDPRIKRGNLRTAHESPKFHLVEADIREVERLDELAAKEKFDGIVHLAARAGVRPSLEQPELYVRVNVVGTTRLLDLAVKHSIPKFIFASSSSVYGDREGAPFREDDCVDYPISPYAATKKAGELLGFTYHHLYGLAVSCLRFFTVYGARQRPEMAIHKFARQIDRGEPLTMYGDGTSRRDFTYFEDIVDGVVASLERARGYRVYNLGNSHTVELRHLIELLESALGKKAKLKKEPHHPGDPLLTCADVDRARKELGYEPKTEIREGIERFVQWFRANGQPA